MASYQIRDTNSGNTFSIDVQDQNKLEQLKSQGFEVLSEPKPEPIVTETPKPIIEEPTSIPKTTTPKRKHWIKGDLRRSIVTGPKRAFLSSIVTGFTIGSENKFLKRALDKDDFEKLSNYRKKLEDENPISSFAGEAVGSYPWMALGGAVLGGAGKALSMLSNGKVMKGLTKIGLSEKGYKTIKSWLGTGVEGATVIGGYSLVMDMNKHGYSWDKVLPNLSVGALLNVGLRGAGKLVGGIYNKVAGWTDWSKPVTTASLKDVSPKVQEQARDLFESVAANSSDIQKKMIQKGIKNVDKAYAEFVDPLIKRIVDKGRAVNKNYSIRSIGLKDIEAEIGRSLSRSGKQLEKARKTIGKNSKDYIRSLELKAQGPKELKKLDILDLSKTMETAPVAQLQKRLGYVQSPESIFGGIGKNLRKKWGDVNLGDMLKPYEEDLLRAAYGKRSIKTLSEIYKESPTKMLSKGDPRKAAKTIREMRAVFEKDKKKLDPSSRKLSENFIKQKELEYNMTVLDLARDIKKFYNKKEFFGLDQGRIRQLEHKMGLALRKHPNKEQTRLMKKIDNIADNFEKAKINKDKFKIKRYEKEMLESSEELITKFQSRRIKVVQEQRNVPKYLSWNAFQRMKNEAGRRYKLNANKSSAKESESAEIWQTIYNNLSRKENKMARLFLRDDKKYEAFLKNKQQYEWNKLYSDTLKDSAIRTALGKSLTNMVQGFFQTYQGVFIFTSLGMMAGIHPIISASGAVVLTNLQKSFIKEMSRTIKPYNKGMLEKFARSGISFLEQGGIKSTKPGRFVEGLQSGIKKTNKLEQFNKGPGAYGYFTGEALKKGKLPLATKTLGGVSEPRDEEERTPQSVKPIDEVKQSIGLDKKSKSEDLINLLKRTLDNPDEFNKATEPANKNLRSDGYDAEADEFYMNTVTSKSILQSILPEADNISEMTLNPDAKPMYSKEKIRSFNNNAVAFFNPVESIKKILKGDYSVEEIGILKSVYPTFYQDSMLKVIQGVRESKKPLNNDQKMRLYRLTGFAVDSSVKEEYMMYNTFLDEGRKHRESEDMGKMNKKLDTMSKMGSIQTQIQKGEKNL